MYINLFDLLFFLRDCLWGIVYSFLHEYEQDQSTFSSSKSPMFLDILIFFKEFLGTEDDFQQILPPSMVDIVSELFSLG